MEKTLKYLGKNTRVLLSCILLFFISSCDLQNNDPVQNYLSRLSNSLDQPLVNLSDALITQDKFPRLNQVSRHLPKIENDQTINLLEFIRLQSCELQRLIGEKNNSLGKLSTDSQTLIYELQFLQLAKACIHKIQTDAPELSEQLKHIILKKQQLLPHRIWSATLGGGEFKDLWNTKLSKQYPDNTNTGVLQAINTINHNIEQWLQGEWDIDTNEFEENLYIISQGDAGQLFRAYEYLSAAMESATTTLKTRLDRRPICFKNKISEKGKIVRNVIIKYFIGEVQPWAAKLQSRNYQLLPAIKQIENQLQAIEPNTYREWREDRDTWIKIAESATKTHALELQVFFKHCGLTPGAQ